MANIEGFDSFRLIWSHREDNSEVKVDRAENTEIVCKYANQKRIFISHTGVMLPCCFMNSESLQSYGNDEYYTDLYRMSEAERAMQFADWVVFMGTSFSVNITSIALRYALSNNAKIEIVDPNPIDLNISGIKYHKMTASEYVSKLDDV